MYSSASKCRRGALFVAGLLSIALVVSACVSDSGEDAKSEEPLLIYVGRDKELVDPLIDQFTEETGIEVQTRYADTPELATTLLTEGDKTDADVFFSQDAGALGALSEEGAFKKLDKDVLSQVPERYRSSAGDWVGITGRARIAVYDSEKLEADQVPDKISDFTDPEWTDRVGFPPGNAGFQAFVTAFRVSEGDDAAKKWLDGIAKNYKSYEKNGAVLEAVNEGSLDVGLINHYYWYEKAAEVGADKMRAQIKWLAKGDPGSLVNATGVGVISDHPDAAKFVEYLLSEDGQKYFVEKTFEYPMIEGVDAPEGLPPIEDVQGPEVDLGDLSDLEGTVKMIEEAGLN